MKEKHCYELGAGTWSSGNLYNNNVSGRGQDLDDRKARRLFARWLRLCYKPNEFGPDTAMIRRAYMPGVAVPAKGWVTIDSFELSSEAIAEFIRAYDQPRFS